MPLRQVNSDNSERSGPHRKIERILDEMGLSYVSEQPFPPFKIDIYLPEWHIGIEVDGPFHSQKKDVIRDAYLYDFYGLPLLRLKVATGWTRRQKVEVTVIKFIEKQEPSTEERKAIKNGRY